MAHIGAKIHPSCTYRHTDGTFMQQCENVAVLLNSDAMSSPSCDRRAPITAFLAPLIGIAWRCRESRFIGSSKQWYCPYKFTFYCWYNNQKSPSFCGNLTATEA
ncbi:hypothetical protein [Floridanema aerugineum]|uniref:Uncharacterized protein n=1 Tax=Floridaenema aerugineum BLCC-F46 TaxID=3153654 RepID=A0ABV4WY02_9CYAN